MKIERLIQTASFTCIMLTSTFASAQGIPEPGLIMYGTVTNSNGGSLVTGAIVSWQISGGSPVESVSMTTTMVNVNGRQFYIARVPFETRIIPGLAQPLTKTPGTLGLAAAGNAVTYTRSATVNGTNASILPPKSGSFTFSATDRGSLEEVDLSAPLAAGMSFSQWLTLYGLPASSNPNSDPTGKGMTLYQDYVAGTDPNNPKSLFKLESTLKPVLQNGQFSGITIQWDSVPGKSYSIFRSLDLGKTFTPLQTGVSATTPLTSFSDPSAVGSGPYFYKILVNP